MIKSITNFLIIFFIFQQLQSQIISQIDQNGYKPFCDETLQIGPDETLKGNVQWK